MFLVFCGWGILYVVGRVFGLELAHSDTPKPGLAGILKQTEQEVFVSNTRKEPPPPRYTPAVNKIECNFTTFQE